MIKKSAIAEYHYLNPVLNIKFVIKFIRKQYTTFDRIGPQTFRRSEVGSCSLRETKVSIHLTEDTLLLGQTTALDALRGLRGR
eukprot:scaffold3022_cov150-Pinguiococcus_pyrenoidosus.AAC.7